MKPPIITDNTCESSPDGYRFEFVSMNDRGWGSALNRLYGRFSKLFHSSRIHRPKQPDGAPGRILETKEDGRVERTSDEVR